MEDIRPYLIEDDQRRIAALREEERRTFEWEAPSDEEMPFHIPRD
jgi:hypothetical protein